MAETAVLLSITGRVQGIGFRFWMAREAERRGLRGWVRNRPDGSVEALLIGEGAAVEAMIGACRRGPPGAQVAAIRRAPAKDDGSPGFEQRPTG